MQASQVFVSAQVLAKAICKLLPVVGSFSSKDVSFSRQSSLFVILQPYRCKPRVFILANIINSPTDNFAIGSPYSARDVPLPYIVLRQPIHSEHRKLHR